VQIASRPGHDVGGVDGRCVRLTAFLPGELISVVIEVSLPLPLQRPLLNSVNR